MGCMKIRHWRRLRGYEFPAVGLYGRARAEGTATLTLLRDALDNMGWGWDTHTADGGALGDMRAYAAEMGRWGAGAWAPCAIAGVHLLHQSEEHPEQVAYLPSPAKLMRILPHTHPTRPGQRDALYTRTTPGKALRALCPDMSDEDIKTAANEWLAGVRGNSYALHILDNDAEQWTGDAEGLQDEWYRLYDTIQVDYSCMRGSHGPRAYGLPGNSLGLAYLTDGHGALMVRTIIHRHGGETHFHRVFPSGNMDFDKARAFFAAQGWTENRDLDGFRLALVDHPDGGWCCPYIDGDTQCVSERAGHLLITSDGDHDATETTGRWVEIYATCDHCGDDILREDDAYSVYDSEQIVCRHCLAQYYVLAYVSRRDQEYILAADAVYCGGTRDHYDSLDTAARHDVYPCADDGYLYMLDDLELTSRGFIYAGAPCLVRLYREDPDGNVYAHREDTVTVAHPLTNEARTYHEDDTDGIAEWEAEIEADKAEAEAEEAEEVAA